MKLFNDTTPKKILLTGARNPMTMVLARLLKQSGHTVFLMDNLRFAFSRFSNAIEKYFRAPAPIDDPEKFVNYLLEIIQKNKIDLLIPTNEEIFYIAQYKDLLSRYCQVISDDFNKIKSLHHKYDLIEIVKDHEISVPKSFLVQSIEGALKFDGTYLFKPIYSRFADKVLISATNKTLKKLKYPCVAQKIIKGKEISSFSIAYNGRVTAHVVYEHPYNLGKGSGIYLIKTINEKIEAFAKSICHTMDYSGLIGFDYIIDDMKNIYLIDCNPRLTSGIHFFNQKDQLLEAFLGISLTIKKGSVEKNQMNGLTLVTIHGLKSFLNGKLFKFLKNVFQSKDIIFDRKDPLPFFAQILTLIEFFWISIVRKIPLKEAFYIGNAWNGQWERVVSPDQNISPSDSQIMSLEET